MFVLISFYFILFISSVVLFEGPEPVLLFRFRPKVAQSEAHTCCQQPSPASCQARQRLGPARMACWPCSFFFLSLTPFLVRQKEPASHVPSYRMNQLHGKDQWTVSSSFNSFAACTAQAPMLEPATSENHAISPTTLQYGQLP